MHTTPRRSLLIAIATAVLAVSACKKDKAKDEAPAPAPVKVEPAGSATTPPPAGSATTPPADMAPPPTPAKPADDWKPFLSAEGGYQASFPGAPAESVQHVDTPVGPLDMHMAMLETPSGAFLVSWQEQPKKGTHVPKQILDGNLDGVLKAFPDAKGIEKTEITMGSYPGRSMKFETASLGATHNTHTFVVGNRIYQLTAMIRTGADASQVTTFFDSFQLTKK